MPNINDVLEPILADLEACEEYARGKIEEHRGLRVYPKDAPVLAMARICASLRPVLEQANELAADLEVAEARQLTNEECAAVIAMASLGMSWATSDQEATAKLAEAGIEKLLEAINR